MKGKGSSGEGKVKGKAGKGTGGGGRDLAHVKLWCGTPYVMAYRLDGPAKPYSGTPALLSVCLSLP